MGFNHQENPVLVLAWLKPNETEHDIRQSLYHGHDIFIQKN